MFNHSKLGAMRESLVIKWLRLLLHIVANFFNAKPLPLCSSLSKKTSQSNDPMIDSNGRGMDVVEFKMEWVTVDSASVDRRFRHGRAPAGRNSDPWI
jgi:hypothetical protein